MKNIEMTAVFEPCDEGGFIAYVQEIPGINTQGETIEEAKDFQSVWKDTESLVAIIPFGFEIRSL